MLARILRWAFTSVFIVGGFVVIMAVAVLWDGVAFMILWNWFMPVLFGLPELSLAAAIAVSLVVGFLTSRYRKSDDTDKWGPWIFLLFKPIIAVLIGFILKSFV